MGLEMTLENGDVRNVQNVCWQRVPNRWTTSHWKGPFSELGESWWNYIWKLRVFTVAHCTEAQHILVFLFPFTIVSTRHYGRSCITPQTPHLSNIPLQNNPLTFGRYLFACALVCHVSGKKSAI